MLNYFLKTVYATSGLIFIQFKTLPQYVGQNHTASGSCFKFHRAAVLD